MFSIFKKKEQSKEDNKLGCLGVKYKKDESISQEDLESCFEFYNQVSTKVFTPKTY